MTMRVLLLVAGALVIWLAFLLSAVLTSVRRDASVPQAKSSARGTSTS